MPWTIYKLHLRGRPRHKGYVGVTNNFDRRMQEYSDSTLEPAKRRYIHQMLKKHGLAAFDVFVLEVVGTEEEGYRAEKRHIRAEGTHVSHGGWNVTRGGREVPEWVKKRAETERRERAWGQICFDEYSRLKVERGL